MGFLDWLFGWKPEKYQWYSFYDIRKSSKDWTNALKRFEAKDSLKIAPFIYLKGKKYRGKFYVTKNYCEIIAGKHKLIVPLNRCSFKEKRTEHYQGQSHVTEYYITLVIKDVSKEDYDRYREFKNKNRIYTFKNCGYPQGRSWDGKLRRCKGC